MRLQVFCVVVGLIFIASSSGEVVRFDFETGDMQGFEPCEVDRKREAKYAMRQRIEKRNREAIRDGKKAYDE